MQTKKDVPGRTGQGHRHHLGNGGRYERDEVKPSIEVASKIAEALEVSLDYLAGNNKQLLEKNIVKRIADIQALPQEDKGHLFALMDAFLRDHKAKKAYAS